MHRIIGLTGYIRPLTLTLISSPVTAVSPIVRSSDADSCLRDLFSGLLSRHRHCQSTATVAIVDDTSAPEFVYNRWLGSVVVRASDL